MLRRIVAGAVISLAALGCAQADTLTVGGGWDTFAFGPVGSALPTFTFTLASSAKFNITDAFADGDQFSITINGVDEGNTSTPTNDGTKVGDDFDAAFASPLFSHGSYLLGPGSYTVGGEVALSPYGGGGAGAELVAAGAPEPSTWAMLLLGFAGAGMAGRRAVRKSARFA